MHYSASRLTIPVLLCILVCTLLFAGCAGTAPSSPAAQTPPDAVTTIPAGIGPVMLMGVPDVRQAEFYSCGASSFQAVMNYYGKDSFESDLRVMLNTTPTHGTYPWDMVRVAQQQGFEAEWKENLTVNDLEASLRQGVPVIIDGQRVRALDGTWENSWDAGHYMVVYGLDDRNVYLEDPYLLGSRLNMTRETFVASWHDYESEIPVPPDAKKYYHLGVFIYGTPPAVRPAFVGPFELPPIVKPAPATQ